jgi:putative transposase
VNHKTVQKLMVEMQLKSLVRPKRYKAFQGAVAEAAPNHLQRDFEAAQPNEKWVTDVTEFKVNNRKLYLSPVMDLYNREIVSYELAEHPLPAMIESMLTKAFDRLDPKERPILHSDQGWQYRMPSFRQRLQRKGLVQSMSRRGNCLDNAAMESFFATLKCELFYVNKFESIETLKSAIHDYIRYYNVDRIKLSLQGLSPVGYRLQAGIDLGRVRSGQADCGNTRVDHEYMAQPGSPPAAWQGPEEVEKINIKAYPQNRRTSTRKDSYTAE